MSHKERVVIPSRYSGKIEDIDLIYEIIFSKKLKKGQISVLVQNDLSISVIANKALSIDEINEILCIQYRDIELEIERVKSKRG